MELSPELGDSLSDRRKRRADTRHDSYLGKQAKLDEEHKLLNRTDLDAHVARKIAKATEKKLTDTRRRFVSFAERVLSLARQRRRAPKGCASQKGSRIHDGQ